MYGSPQPFVLTLLGPREVLVCAEREFRTDTDFSKGHVRSSARLPSSPTRGYPAVAGSARRDEHRSVRNRNLSLDCQLEHPVPGTVRWLSITDEDAVLALTHRANAVVIDTTQLPSLDRQIYFHNLMGFQMDF